MKGTISDQLEAGLREPEIERTIRNIGSQRDFDPARWNRRTGTDRDFRWEIDGGHLQYWVPLVGSSTDRIEERVETLVEQASILEAED